MKREASSKAHCHWPVRLYFDRTITLPIAPGRMPSFAAQRGIWPRILPIASAYVRMPTEVGPDWRYRLALPGKKVGYSLEMTSAPYQRSTVNEQAVPATDIVRHFSEWQDRSSERPVIILHHGRPRSILLSVDHYGDLLAAQGGHDEHAEQLRGQLDVVLARMKSLFIQFNQHQQVVRINGAAASFLGRNPGDVLNEKVYLLFEGPARDRIEKATQALSASGLAQSLILALRPTGKRRYHVDVAPFPGGGILLATDITSQAAAEELLAAQETQQQLLSMMTGCAVGRIEPDGTLLQVHPTLTRLIRLRPQTVGQICFCELFEGQSQRKCELHLAHIFAGKGPVCCRADIITRDRGAVPVRLFLAPKMREDKVDAALFAILDDALGSLPMR